MRPAQHGRYDGGTTAKSSFHCVQIRHSSSSATSGTNTAAVTSVIKAGTAIAGGRGDAGLPSGASGLWAGLCGAGAVLEFSLLLLFWSRSVASAAT